MPRQFIVPQFIDVEPKIVWFITARQFVILLVAGGLIFVAFKLADFALFVILAILIAGIAIVFSFVKVNGQLFHIFVINFIQTYKKPGLRIWGKERSTQELRMGLKEGKKEPEEQKIVIKEPLESYRLSELSLMVDTGGVYRGEQR